MAIDVRELRAQPLDPEIEEELDRFEDGARRYLAGEIDDDVFRVFRLNQGIYGQRQGGHNQMLRVKIPYGQRRRPTSSRCSPTSPRPTRAAGATSPPARTCSSTSCSSSRRPRCCASSRRSGSPAARRAATPCATSMGCHLAGACPYEVLDIIAVGRGHQGPLPAQPARAAPAPQVQDQLLGLRHRLRPGDVQRRRRDRGAAARSPTAPSSPASRCSSPAASAPTRTRRRRSRSSPRREDLLPTIEACLRTFDHYGNRDNKLRARMKWLVDTMGIDELRERILKERKFLRAVAR